MKYLILFILPILILLTARWGIAWWSDQKKPDAVNPPLPKSLDICTHKPNCVSSMEQRPQWHIKPLVIPGTPSSAWLALEQAILDLPKAKIAFHQEGHIHATFHSRLFGFVDDGFFILDSEQGIIQMRSASRLGHSDFGANRHRLETIRARYRAILEKSKNAISQ